MYRAQGINVVDDLSDCDILLGIKEVPKELLWKYFIGTLWKGIGNNIEKYKSYPRIVGETSIQCLDTVLNIKTQGVYFIKIIT